MAWRAKAQRDLQRDQPLVGAVAQVVFKAVAGLVGGGDQPLPRRPHILDEPDVAQDQACLPGHGLDQRLPGWSQWFRGEAVTRSEPSRPP